MLIEIVLCLLVVYLLVKLFQKPDGLPPGEWGWPVIGAISPMKMSVEDYMKMMRKKHGDFFLLKLGSLKIVFLCNYSLIKETFSKSEYSFRNALPSFQIFRENQNRGLIISEGGIWEVLRRFSLRNLKDLGMGKSRMESVIETEVEAYVSFLSSKTGKAMDMDNTLNVSVINVIWNLVAGCRFNIDDADVQHLTKLIDRSQYIQGGPIGFLNIFPWIQNILPNSILRKLLKIPLLEEIRDDLMNWLKKSIQEHENNFDPENIEDFIDVYLNEMKTSDRKDVFTHENLLVCLGDMFIAGSDSTANTLRWFILLMGLYPEVQEKVHRTIRSVVPDTTFPSLTDKNKLAYLEAVIYEVMRFATLTPYAMPHAVSENLQFQGYKIPKGTYFVSAIGLCHQDPVYWSHPHQFYPQHFLDEEGRFFVPKEGFLPFGSGRRQCIGESLAKMDLFLFAAAILQRFKIVSPEDVKLEMKSRKTAVIFNLPESYKVVLEKRYAF